MVIRMKPGAKKQVLFQSHGPAMVYIFMEPVVSQQGRYIMARMMPFQEIDWKVGVSTMEMQKRLKPLPMHKHNHEYL